MIINKLHSKKDCLPKYYIGYKILARDNGNYFGSSKLLQEDIKNIGLKYFLKIILKRFNNDIDARAYEEKLLTYFNARYNELFYNLTNGDKNFVAKPQYGNVCLRGENRTEKQKIGDKNKYKIRSEKRIKADKQHSFEMKRSFNEKIKNRLLTGAKKWRESAEGEKISKTMKLHFSKERKGKTKDLDNGRMITSQKLKGNENAKKGAIKMAKMTDEEFNSYCSTISQHHNIQKQMQTRRLKGINFLLTGIWEKYQRCKST